MCSMRREGKISANGKEEEEGRRRSADSSTIAADRLCVQLFLVPVFPPLSISLARPLKLPIVLCRQSFRPSVRAWHQRNVRLFSPPSCLASPRLFLATPPPVIGRAGGEPLGAQAPQVEGRRPMGGRGDSNTAKRRRRKKRSGAMVGSGDGFLEAVFKEEEEKERRAGRMI